MKNNTRVPGVPNRKKILLDRLRGISKYSIQSLLIEIIFLTKCQKNGKITVFFACRPYKMIFSKTDCTLNERINYKLEIYFEKKEKEYFHFMGFEPTTLECICLCIFFQPWYWTVDDYNIINMVVNNVKVERYNSFESNFIKIR